MGFEQKIPPIPTRQQQIEGITRLEEDWLNQPYYKYYMNESLRKPKMKFADNLNKVYRDLFFNMAVAGIVLMPLAYFSRRFFVSRNNLPMTRTPEYYDRQRSDLHVRRMAHMKFSHLAWISGTLFFGFCMTDFSQIQDKYYDYVHKPEKMI